MARVGRMTVSLCFTAVLTSLVPRFIRVTLFSVFEFPAILLIALVSTRSLISLPSSAPLFVPFNLLIGDPVSKMIGFRAYLHCCDNEICRICSLSSWIYAYSSVDLPGSCEVDFICLCPGIHHHDFKRRYRRSWLRLLLYFFLWRVWLRDHFLF